MAMMLHDSERLDAKAPLESSIARPPSFHVYRALLAAAFSNECVYLPYGLEDATNHPSIEAMSFGSKRPEAPLPCGSGSQSASSVGIRPMYGAFMAASWIVHYDARLTPAQFLARGASVGAGKPAKEMIAHSMLSELTDAAKVGLSPGNALGRSTATTLGPHDSQRSRRIAATLLLPRAVSGRTRANRRDITFLDAFALIASSTNRPCFSVDPNGVPHSASDGGGDGGEAGRAVALTDMVRMSVVAGGGAVASFAKTLDIASTPMFTTDEWKRSSILCFSYVVGSTVLHTPLVIDDCTGVDTVVQAVRTIQNAALRGQILSKGELVLPHGFVSYDYVNIDDECDDDASDSSAASSHFLRLQAEKQHEFRRLHIREAKIDVPIDVVRQFDFDGSHGRPRFVRICSNQTNIDRLKDESHCPGMLFSTNDELMVEYLNRNRLQAPPHPWTREWPPYGLSPPLDEERHANASVLWLRIETHKVGSQLNLFFPRVLMGKEVTDAVGCRMFSVIPTLCPVESVVCSGNYVLPCTTESMLPAGVGEMASRLYNAFGRAIDESFDYLNNMKSPVAMDDARLGITHRAHQPPSPSCSLQNAAATPPQNTGEQAATPSSASPTRADDAFIAALMGAKLGHPASTCGDAYDLLQEHSASELAYSRSFHALVAAGVSKLGAEVSMHQLMEEAASALIDRLSINSQRSVPTPCSEYEDSVSDSDRKRPRTPYGAARSPPAFVPPPRITDSLRQDSMASGLSEASTFNMGESSGVSGVTSSSSSLNDLPLLAPLPLTRQDSLRRHLSDDLNLRRLAGIAGLKPYSLAGFDNGEAWLSFPLDSQSVEDLVEAIWSAYGMRCDIYQDAVSSNNLISARIGVPTENGITTQLERFLGGFKFVYSTYYRIMKSHGRDILEDFDTFILFRPFTSTDATLYSITATTDSLQFDQVATDQLLEPLQKMGKVLFSMSQSSYDMAAAVSDLPFQVCLNVWRSVPGTSRGAVSPPARGR
jgi:hypothetical protein